MEQKTINQNKLQTLLCIIALTLGVLVSAVLFSMPPVHAASSPTGSIIVETEGAVNDYCNRNIKVYSGDATSLKCAILIMDESNDVKNMNALIYTTDISSEFTYYSVITSTWPKNPQNNSEDVRNISSSGMAKVTLSDGTIVRYSIAGVGNTDWSIISNTPCYDPISGLKSLTSDASAKIFLEHLLVTGDLKPNNDPPDTVDDLYCFTGFTMNGKTARWTGTTERSFAKEVDVEEYVKVSYAWSTTTEPDNLGELQPYDGEFSTSDKHLTLPWSEMEDGKTDFQFIRQVKIFPCYRVPHLAYYIGQPVTIYYNADGTIDKIEQTTIPTDSETIGNDISLIGFRYDNSFHAEWVDVWSNGVNKSAFDLSGSQYLSLGVKAVYYDGSKSDIDFYSLDRKNLTWNKPFSDFKENNGSPIKSLYFTPYTKTGVNNPWNKGNSTVVNFDENGNASSSFDTGDDGTVHLNDFKLTGVVWNKPVVKNGTITWTGTTPNSDLLFVPDSDTLVTATYPRYDADLNTSYETWSTTTIGKGSMKVNVDYLIDYYKNSELAWNGEMWLTPCYKKGGVLYVGDPVIINCLKGTVSDIVVDKDSGKAEQVDKTDQNKSDADSILNVGNQFYSIINGLIGSLQQLPALLTAIFGFLPSSIINLLYASFAVIVICRILGR